MKNRQALDQLLQSLNDNASLARKLALGAAALALSGAASAQVTFDLNYQDSKSDAPAWDPNGRLLKKMVAAAAEHWEDIFAGESRSVTVRYRWFDPDAGGFGLTPKGGTCGNPWADTFRPLGILAPNTYTIRFYTRDCGSDIAWFVDGDPSEHSEFLMSPITVSSPEFGDSTFGISGAPHSLMESGFEGTVRTDVPAAAGRGISDAATGGDLYSIALHELGHALGLGTRGESDANADGDYDIPLTIQGGGASISVPPDDSGVDPAHIDCPHALMFPSIAVATRRLPSAADIQTIASINGWTHVEYPRKYFHGESVDIFSRRLSWLDEDKPSSSQGAVIDHGPVGRVDVTKVINVQGLFLADTTELWAADHEVNAGTLLKLSANASLYSEGGSVNVDRVYNAGLRLQQNYAGQFNCRRAFEGIGGSVSVFHGTSVAMAELNMASGDMRMINSSLETAYLLAVVRNLDLDGLSSELRGGTSQFSGLLTLVNDGLIIAQNGDLEFLPYHGGVKFDLDGDDLDIGEIDATSGSIHFGAPATDLFNGTASIGGWRTLSVDGELGLGDFGQVLFKGELSSLVVHHLDVQGGFVIVDALAGDRGFIMGPQTMHHDGRFRVNSYNELHLVGNTNYYGGIAADGLGALVQIGDANVFATDEETTIGVSNYIWDGEQTSSPGVYSDTTVHPGATLVIESQVSWMGDGYDGTVTVKEGAVLEVDEDWILEGELVLEGGTVRLGGQITNLGIIRGYGTIETSVVNSGLIVCEGSGIDFDLGLDGGGSVVGGCFP